MHTHTHLCLEAEDGDDDADNGSDTQSEKHYFCVIVTKKQREANSEFWGKLDVYIILHGLQHFSLPGNGSSHVGQSQGL